MEREFLFQCNFTSQPHILSPSFGFGENLGVEEHEEKKNL